MADNKFDDALKLIENDESLSDNYKVVFSTKVIQYLQNLKNPISVGFAINNSLKIIDTLKFTLNKVFYKTVFDNINTSNIHCIEIDLLNRYMFKKLHQSYHVQIINKIQNRFSSRRDVLLKENIADNLDDYLLKVLNLLFEYKHLIKKESNQEIDFVKYWVAHKLSHESKYFNEISTTKERKEFFLSSELVKVKIEELSAKDFIEPLSHKIQIILKSREIDFSQKHFDELVWKLVNILEKMTRSDNRRVNVMKFFNKLISRFQSKFKKLLESRDSGKTLADFSNKLYFQEGNGLKSEDYIIFETKFYLITRKPIQSLQVQNRKDIEKIITNNVSKLSNDKIVDIFTFENDIFKISSTEHQQLYKVLKNKILNNKEGFDKLYDFIEDEDGKVKTAALTKHKSQEK